MNVPESSSSDELSPVEGRPHVHAASEGSLKHTAQPGPQNDLPNASETSLNRGVAPWDRETSSVAPFHGHQAIAHIEIVRVIERLHRRSLDLMRADLIEVQVDDLSPSQVMMLFTIGQNEISVRQLIERGYYLGSNASYSLKRLVETGYVIRKPSVRDRRSARIRLSEKGHALCELIKRKNAPYHKLMVRHDRDLADFATTARTLERLEYAWSDVVRNREGSGVDSSPVE